MIGVVRLGRRATRQQDVHGGDQPTVRFGNWSSGSPFRQIDTVVPCSVCGALLGNLASPFLDRLTFSEWCSSDFRAVFHPCNYRITLARFNPAKRVDLTRFLGNSVLFQTTTRNRVFGPSQVGSEIWQNAASPQRMACFCAHQVGFAVKTKHFQNPALSSPSME